MSTVPHSRVSLADINILILNSNFLSDRQKADYRSAVNTVARVVGADPALISADPAALRRRLEAVAPAAHGLSPGRWSNVRSLLGKSLTLARPMMPSRVVAPLLPAWEHLMDGLSRGRRDHVLAMVRFLGVRGVGPGSVTLADLEAYREAILNDRLRGRPEKTWDMIVWTWNACRREISGWPDIHIPRKSKKKTYVHPWSLFPPSLKEEVGRWRLRQSCRDLSEDGPDRPLRETSLETREYQLRVGASVLVQLGDAPESITSLSVQLSVENFKRILRALLDRHGGRTSVQVSQIASFLVSVARHWLKVDDTTLERLRKIASQVRFENKGMTAKNRERLRPFHNDDTVARFQSVPWLIRADVEKSKLPARRKALLAQRAAAIAILMVIPIRLRNLVLLDLESHLISRGNRLYLVVPEHEVKNSYLIDFEVPDDTAELLSWYVREHRGHLLEGPSSALFPGEGGNSKAASTLAGQIMKAVFQYTGLKVNVHLFRHIAAKLYLDRNPGDYVTVQRVLGHKSIATTTSIYTGMETRAAGRHFAKVVRQRLNDNETKPVPKKRSRR
jgi:integrase